MSQRSPLAGSAAVWYLVCVKTVERCITYDPFPLECVMKSGLFVFGIVLLAACSDSTNPGGNSTAVTYQVSPVAYDADMGVLRGTVSVRDTTADTLSVGYSDCSVSLRFYSTSNRSGTPIYDSANNGCSLTLNHFDLTPGDSAVFSAVALKSDVDSAIPAAGTYYATIHIQTSLGIVDLDGGSIALPISAP